MMPDRRTMGSTADVVDDTLRYLRARENGIGARRITDLRLRNDFTIVRLDDGSCGACMSYSRLSAPVLKEVQQRLSDFLHQDPLLLRWFSSASQREPIAMSLRASTVSALSSPLLRTDRDDVFRVSNESPHHLFGVQRAMVIGFGGYMESLAYNECVQKLHVADLEYRTRRNAMDAVIARYKHARPNLNVTISDGSDTEQHFHESDLVCITGSALCNGTMDGLLKSAREWCTIVVQGQSASIYPLALFDRGVNLVATTIKPSNIIEVADQGHLADIVEGGLPFVYLTPTAK